MATKTWIATTASTWATAASWSPPGIPAAGDDVIFNAASAACTVGANTNALISLTCTGYTNTLTINANLIVAGNVTLSSNLRFTTINTTIQIADTWILSKGLTSQGTPLGSIIMRSSVPGTQRTFTLLNNGVTTQDIDYLNVTDIDGSAGLTAWTYKGTAPSNSPNWYLMTTQPPTVSQISFS